MMVSVETTGALERRMTVQIPAERVENEVAQRLKKVGKTAKLKGFRPGKIPAKVIRKRYGGQVRQEVLSDVLNQSFGEAIAKEQLRPAGGPKIESTQAEEGQDLEYTAVFEVYPEIQLTGLDNIKISKPRVDIGEEDLDRMIESLRKQRETWETVERAAGNGDRVTIDFAGTIGGEPFEGGEGSDVNVVLGADGMLADFEKGLHGLDAGKSKTIKVKFPKDYGSEELAGKKAQFEVQASKVEQSILPEVDDEFVAAFGVTEGGIEALRREVSENMQRELDQKVQNDLKAQVLDHLIEKNPIDLPGALVEAEIDALWQDSARRLGIQQETAGVPREAFEKPARRRVSLGLLVGELIRTQEVEVDRNLVDQRLTDMVSTYDDPEAILNMYRSSPEMLQRIEMMVLEDQVVNGLIEQAEVKEKDHPFAKYMNLND